MLDMLMINASPQTSRLGRFCRCRRAATAIEFAILAPIFLVLLLGMIAYGIYFGASHSVQQLAADAARISMGGLSAQERTDLVNDFITRNGAGYPFLDPRKLTVDARDSAMDGSRFVVSVSYDATDLPIWNLFHGIAMPGTTIQRQSTIRLGGL